jgi:hypothetical protein
LEAGHTELHVFDPEATMAKKRWIQKAVSRMKRRGTVGSFGKATKKKIAAGKRAGGRRAKQAVFAQNVARGARKKKKR